jgi:hypothetical protein
MSDTINLSKAIKQVQAKDGQLIDIPPYCRKRISFFRYSKGDESLGITCNKCQEVFQVLKLSREEGNDLHWKDIHKEAEYHFMSAASGYSPECVRCKNKLVQEQIKINKPVPKVEEKISYTVFLTPENKKYLQLYKIVYQEDITEVINSLIDNLRAKRPIEIKTYT